MAEDDLKKEVEALRKEVAILKGEGMPEVEAAIVRYDLNENEQRVLRLLALGLGQREASRAAGLGETYVKDALGDSMAFAKAYKDVRVDFDQWQEGRLRMALPRVWQEIDAILNMDPEPYLENGDVRFATTILSTKTRILDKLLRLNYAQESKVVHQHEIEIPMLQMAQENLGLLAEHLQRLTVEDKQGVLKDRLPESQIVDLTPDQYEMKFNHQPRREDGYARCLECGTWVSSLGAHIVAMHNMNSRAYKAKHNLDPMEALDAKSETAD